MFHTIILPLRANLLLCIQALTLPLPTRCGLSECHSLTTDNLGSVSTITDQSGNLIADETFDPWGWPTSGAGGWQANEVTSKSFTFQELLSDEFAYDFNGRILSNAASSGWVMPLMFLSPDPAPVQDPANTQSYNRYAYALDNPLTYTDPTGYDYQLECQMIGEPEEGSPDSSITFEDMNGNPYPGQGSDGGSAENVVWTTLCEEVGTPPILNSPTPGVPYAGGGGGFPSIGSPGTVSPAPKPTPTPTPKDTCPAGSSCTTPQTSSCTLVAPTGQYQTAAGVNATFNLTTAQMLSSALQNLNQQGIVPVITSGYRSPGTQAALTTSNSPYVITPAQVSWHEAGAAVDFGQNSNAGNFPAIVSAMIQAGFVWGGTFSIPDQPHFQSQPAGTSPSAATVQACARAASGG